MGQRDKQQIARNIGIQIDNQKDRNIGIWIDSYKDRKIDKQIDSYKDRKIDKQIDGSHRAAYRESFSMSDLNNLKFNGEKTQFMASYGQINKYFFQLYFTAYLLRLINDS